jgi:uncharacterized protein YjiS (DUF1127 family)
MRSGHPDGIAAGLAALSHRDRARILGEARRMRAEAIAGLLRAAGRGLARLAGVPARPIVSAVGAMGLPERIGLALLWRREFRRVRAELDRYSERELTADLRLSPSEVPAIAAEAADEYVAASGRRGAAWRSRGHEAGITHASG